MNFIPRELGWGVWSIVSEDEDMTEQQAVEACARLNLPLLSKPRYPATRTLRERIYDLAQAKNQFTRDQLLLPVLTEIVQLDQFYREATSNGLVKTLSCPLSDTCTCTGRCKLSKPTGLEDASSSARDTHPPQTGHPEAPP